MKPVYKKMLASMEEKEKASKKRSPKDPWMLYILECTDGTFYTGIAKDLDKRLVKHNKGKASKYTRTRRPVKIIYKEKCKSRTKALVRECEVKALSRSGKEKLTLKNNKM